MKLSKAIFLILILLFFFSRAQAQTILATDWPTRARDASRSAFVPYDLVLDNTQPNPYTRGNEPRLNLKWKKFFGERVEVEMEPLVVGNTVYLGIMNGKLYAMDRNTGATKWVFKAGGPLTDTPTLAYVNSNELRIFFGSADGKVYSLDANTGEKIWDYQTGAAVMSTPSFYNNTLFIGSLDHVFYALDAGDVSSQRVKWSYPTNSPISNTSALGETQPGSGVMGVYFANGDNYAYGFHVNGVKLWEQKMQGAYTKRTMAVYGNGVVMFVTRKPGIEYSQPVENVPAILLSARQPGDVVINGWADFYLQYPERRPLYYFNAQTGGDLWKPTVDKSKYTPLYLPYWGEYSPLVDNQGNAWFGASGGSGDYNLDHDIRLWKINLSTGAYTHAASQDQFLLRFDELGRGTLVNNRYYQTISEDVGYYDISTNTKNNGVFGDLYTFSTHRRPLEFAEYPTTTIFGGMHKHFGRFGGSGPGAFGGGNDAISPLVVSGKDTFMVSFGHLYALTSDPVTTVIKNIGNLDLTTTPSSGLAKAQYRTLLNQNIQKIVQDNAYLSPVGRHWGYVFGQVTPGLGNFWHDGEVVRTLSEAIPFIDEPLQTQFKQYLKNYVQTYLLDGNRYVYRRACVVVETRQIQDPCTSMIGRAWFWNNPNLIAERIYAFYKYAQETSDWQLIRDNWNFIKGVNVYGQMKSRGWDEEAGFFIWEEWIAGNFNPNLQLGAMLAMREMAKQTGDTAVQTEAGTYLNKMLDKRVYWGKYIRGLYDTGQLPRQNFNDPGDWGGNQNASPMPPEGYLDKENEFRHPRYIGRNSSGALEAKMQMLCDAATTGNSYTCADNIETWKTHPYYFVGYHPFLVEVNDLVKQNLSDELSDHIRAVEVMNPWWYMSDMGHQVIIGNHEEDTFSVVAATDTFQAKAYILGETFENLRDYLPWPFEAYDYRDIYRLQNLVALMNAPSSTTPPLLTGDVNNDTLVNVLDVQACVNHFLGLQNFGSRADANDDGSVDVLDVQLIVNVILGG